MAVRPGHPDEQPAGREAVPYEVGDVLGEGGLADAGGAGDQDGEGPLSAGVRGRWCGEPGGHGGGLRLAAGEVGDGGDGADTGGRGREGDGLALDDLRRGPRVQGCGRGFKGTHSPRSPSDPCSPSDPRSPSDPTGPTAPAGPQILAAQDGQLQLP